MDHLALPAEWLFQIGRLVRVRLLPEFLPALSGVASFERLAVGSSFDWERFIAERLESGSRDIYDECLTVMARQLLPQVLQHTSGNQLRTAELLGITRSTLRQKLRALNIIVERANVISHEELD